MLELLAALVGLAFGIGGGKRRRRQGETGEAPGEPRRPLIPRKVLHWSAGGLLALGLAGVAASYLLFDPILRFALDRAAAAAGTEIRFERSAGNLLKGQVALEGVHMRRPAERGLAFDVTAERVALDVVLSSLLGEAEIERAEIVGVRGFVTPPERDKDKDKQAGGRERARRAFVADAIRVEDLALEVRPRGGEAWPFAIARAEVAPLRSRAALFDLLFRSNMQAEIAGQHLSVETREITEFGRETFWRFEDVDAARLRLLVPRTPLTWLEGGVVDVAVDDRWSLEEDWIEMDWRLAFEGVGVAVPEGAGLREKALAAGFAKIVAARGGNAEFRYSLTLDQAQIAVARSGDLAGFWDIVAGQLIGGAGTEEAHDAATEVDGKVKGALGRLRGLLKKGDE